MDSRRHPTHAQRQQPTSNNTQSRTMHHNGVEVKNDNPVLFRSFKRKKSSSSLASVPDSGPSSSGLNGRRAENRIPADSKSIASSSSRQSSTRVFAAMKRPPSLGPDLLVHLSSKKDKSMIEASSKHSHGTHHRRHNDVDEGDRQHSNIAVDRHVLTGPLEVVGYERMKQEVETLKEILHESKKLSRQQAKQLEENKAEVNAVVMVSHCPSDIGRLIDIPLKKMKDKEIELVDLRTKWRKNEELLSTIETSVQCQICMDLPDKPFALNPCGHVFCLSCLQEWFRQAPLSLDVMDVELTDPQYVLRRSKTCPSCRAVVKHRPVPVFMIKSVVMMLKKAKSPHANSSRNRHNNDYLHTEDNPWKGIFASSEEDNDDESQPESDSDDLNDWVGDRHSHITDFEAAFESNATAESETENEEDDGSDRSDDGDYVYQRWAPPSVRIAGYDVEDDDAPETVKLLQRGCSLSMLQRFDVSYSHSSGIVVALRSLDHLYALDDDDEDDADDINMHRVFLGWNINLHPGDIDGEDYMQKILSEIRDVPARWRITPTPGVPFAVDVMRLVCTDEAGGFDTTDTEAWLSD